SRKECLGRPEYPFQDYEQEEDCDLLDAAGYQKHWRVSMSARPNGGNCAAQKANRIPGWAREIHDRLRQKVNGLCSLTAAPRPMRILAGVAAASTDRRA